MYINFIFVKTYTRGEKMTKRKLKPFVIPTIYVLSIITFAVSVYFIQRIVSTKTFTTKEQKIEYVDKEILNTNQYIPVISTGTEIKKPYLAEDVIIARGFYSKDADEATQEKALIYYEGTYMQNSGVDYKGTVAFDVVSILDGTVTSVKQDNILGTTIEIRHKNDLISVYQSLTEITVKENDTVLQGQIIGKSGKNNISADLEEHLHFELYYKGAIVNPEEYYGKKIEEL